MSFLASAQALWSILTAVWFLVGLFVYLALIRQISVRADPVGQNVPKRFEIPEAVIATILVGLLIFNLFKGGSTSASDVDTWTLINSLVLTAVVVMILVAFLVFRGLDIDALGGFSKVGAVRAVALAAILLLLAYPLVFYAEALIERVVGHDSSRQVIVEAFSESTTLQQRIIIITLAVAVAPLAEELVFRFFLYGVMRRYFGIVVGLVFNSLLFAAVHQHLPSFAPLFVLGCCFTVAYEWSGSILVPMAMHSLFNAANLVVLAFPGLVDQ
jgi:membrane protease YdiL (CAAX protease family)